MYSRPRTTEKGNPMKKILVGVLILMVCGSIRAQYGPVPSGAISQDTTPNAPIEEEDKLQLPPLRAVIDSALKYSPLLQTKARDLAILDQESAVDRRKWLDYLYVDGAANYGVFNQLFRSQVQDEGEATVGTLNQSAQGQYYAGVSLKMPLSTFLNRSNQNNIRQLQREQIQWEREDIRRTIRKTIIEEYYTLRYMHESLGTFLETYETLNLSYVKAQKDIENSRMKLDEFGRIAASLGKAKNEYIKAKNDYYAQFELLELFAGVPLR